MNAQFAKLVVAALEEVADFSRADLGDAPLIEDWVIAGAPAPYLVGRVAGHPTVNDGPILTSVLIAISVGEGWARTLNRFYLLGRPLGARNVH